MGVACDGDLGVPEALLQDGAGHLVECEANVQNMTRRSRSTSSCRRSRESGAGSGACVSSARVGQPLSALMPSRLFRRGGAAARECA
jgi:hypothetical protein